MLKHWIIAGAIMMGSEALTAQTAPAYVPRAVTVADTATYLTRTGEVQITGNDGWEAMVSQFDALFLKTHPGFKRGFHPVLKGSSVAIPALEAGTSAFAPMGRAMWEQDRASFRRMHGYDPLDVRIGYDAFGPRVGRKSPPGIYVNKSNPLKGLTVEQVKRVLTQGAKAGEVSRWGQLGVNGKWANRVIHVYGLDPSSGGSASFRAEFLDDKPLTSRLEIQPKPVDAIKAVAEDPYGIGLLGFVDATTISPDARMLPIASEEGQPFTLPTYEAVSADRYPFAAYLHMYLNREPGKPIDPFVQEYLRMVLSAEGQAIIAAQKDTEEGYVPLAPALIAEELKKLD